jgi:hypothetical protein
MKLRIRYSIFPFIVLLSLLLGYPKLLPLLALGLFGFVSYFLGIVFLTLLMSALIYFKIGGLVGILLVALALLFIESAYLDRAKASREHYLILTVTVLMSLPTYLLIRSLAPVLPRFEVTALAMLIIIMLYIFSKMVGGE